MADVARLIGVPHATVRNYFQGRMPAPEVLIKIANHTNVNLNWLLTGVGPMFLGDVRPASFDRLLNERIGQVIDQKLAERGITPLRDLGSVDSKPEFDLTASVLGSSDPHKIMSDWFLYEGREYPADFGVVFFRGWESFTSDEKVDALRDAKKVLDRTLRNS